MKPAQVVTRRIAQKGAMFSPHILPVLVGTTVEWPNYDDILHNVFSFSETKPFDLGLYKSPELKQIAFDLGFSDAGYFTRFFQRRTGSAPTAWRAAAAA